MDHDSCLGSFEGGHHYFMSTIVWPQVNSRERIFQRTARRYKKAFLSDQCKEIEENNRMERVEISSRKLEIPREHFMERYAQ